MEPPPSVSAASTSTERGEQSSVKHRIRHEIITNFVGTACIFAVWCLLYIFDVFPLETYVMLTLLSVLSMPYWDKMLYVRPSTKELIAARLATNFGIFALGNFLLEPTVNQVINSPNPVKQSYMRILIPISSLIFIMTFIAMLRWILFFTMLITDAVLDYFR